MVKLGDVRLEGLVPMASKRRYSATRKVFAFVLVCGLLLIGLVIFGDVGPISIAVVVLVALGITVWLTRPVDREGPPGSEPPDRDTYIRR